MDTNIKDAFLCHNKADKDWVKQLGARIEIETIDGLPSSRRLKVFVDEWDIDYGENAVNRMGAGLTGARFVIVIMSPEFFKSGWTNFEWTDVIAEDPWGAKKKLIPILFRDLSKDGLERITFPAPFKALRHLDFRDERLFEELFQKLLRRLRGLPPLRGEIAESRHSTSVIPLVAAESSDSWVPDRVRDVLLGNMLNVLSFPPLISSATTEKESPSQVRAEAPEAEGHIIRAKRIWTFADLSNASCKLRGVVDIASIQKISSRDWIVDAEKASWWGALINQALTSHLSKLAIRKDEKGRYFFRPNKDGTSRQWLNQGDRPREVAARKTNLGNHTSFWVHHAARISFKRLGERFFLMIEPTYLFTSDGEQPVGGQQMGRMVVMWGGKQRNPDILRNFVFWAKAIAKGGKQIRIVTGGVPIVVSAAPALCVANVGIEMDHVRIGSLLRTADTELDEVAQDIDVVSTEELEDEHETQE